VTIESNRSLGGIAAILIFLGVVSQVTSLIQYTVPIGTVANLGFSAISGLVGVLSFVGIILFLVAMYGFSRDYSESRIFSYILYGIVFVIVAAVVVVAIALFVTLSAMASLFPTIGSSPSSSQISGQLLKLLLPMFPAFGLIGLVWIMFNVRAFNLLGEKSKVNLFKTAAKVLLAGACVTLAVTVIFAVIGSAISLSYNTLLLTLSVPGGLVQDAAWVLLAMAYFSIQVPATLTVAQAGVQATPAQVTGQVRYCTKCGAPNQADALYCARCGQKM